MSKSKYKHSRKLPDMTPAAFLSVSQIATLAELRCLAELNTRTRNSESKTSRFTHMELLVDYIVTDGTNMNNIYSVIIDRSSDIPVNRQAYVELSNEIPGRITAIHRINMNNVSLVYVDPKNISPLYQENNQKT